MSGAPKCPPSPSKKKSRSGWTGMPPLPPPPPGTFVGMSIAMNRVSNLEKQQKESRYEASFLCLLLVRLRISGVDINRLSLLSSVRYVWRLSEQGGSSSVCGVHRDVRAARYAPCGAGRAAVVCLGRPRRKGNADRRARQPVTATMPAKRRAHAGNWVVVQRGRVDRYGRQRAANTSATSPLGPHAHAHTHTVVISSK